MHQSTSIVIILTSWGTGKTMNTRHQLSLTRQLHNHGPDEKMKELSEIVDTGAILLVNLQGEGVILLVNL